MASFGLFREWVFGKINLRVGVSVRVSVSVRVGFSVRVRVTVHFPPIALTVFWEFVIAVYTAKVRGGLTQGEV